MTFNFIKNWFSFWPAYVAEFLGTFVFVFTSQAVFLSNVFYGDIGPIGQALAIGLAFSTMVAATYHLSGGHLNPVITLSLWLTQRLKSSVAFFYIFSQTLASFAATGLVLLIYGNRALQYSLGLPQIQVSLESALLSEILLTSILVFVFFATMVDKRGPSGSGPLFLGFVILSATLVAASTSGAILNPARVLAAAIITGNYDSLVVWIVGSAAAALMGIIYDFLFLRKSQK